MVGYSSPKVVLFVLLAPHLVAKIGLDFCPACVSRPVGRSSLPQDILPIESRTTLDEKSDEFTMAGPGGLMQGCRMGMAPDRVVSIGIFARVKQQSNDLDMTKLRGQRERQVAILAVGARKQPAGVLDASQSRRNRQINPTAAPDQSVQRFQLAVQGGSVERRCWDPLRNRKADRLTEVACHIAAAHCQSKPA